MRTITTELFQNMAETGCTSSLLVLPEIVRQCTHQMELKGEKTSEFTNQVARGLEDMEWIPANLSLLCETIREIKLPAKSKCSLVERLLLLVL